MKIHEYQAKELFSKYGIPLLRRRVATTAQEAAQAAQEFGGRAVVKAQIHAGGRGKGGGIQVAASPEEAAEFAKAMLGRNLVTPQTGPEGAPVHQVLVEELADIQRELYLAITIDRTQQAPIMLASPMGGVSIEEVAASNPDAIYSQMIDPLLGLMPFQTRSLAAALDLQGDTARAAGQVMTALYRVFVENDCTLAEINPLIVTGDGAIVALDAKINLEDDSLFRHKDLQELRDPSQEDELEARAAELGIAYVKLDGDVGCLVNGAGLAMATLDVASAAGAAPANFLDVGGGATAELVADAVEIILSDPKVTRVLVNIFGGILRCDLAASGVVLAYQRKGSNLPLVVRLLGTNVEEGCNILRESGLPVTFADSLAEAAQVIRESG
ncbi:MAG: ADP-forming succinate--CoA ligase subunit beta [Chloroflexi bacterium]|nr:ADP-forming succinate--CoA ligase subunit beta [Chloroflexota bacterium]